MVPVGCESPVSGERVDCAGCGASGRVVSGMAGLEFCCAWAIELTAPDMIREKEAMIKNGFTPTTLANEPAPQGLQIHLPLVRREILFRSYPEGGHFGLSQRNKPAESS